MRESISTRADRLFETACAFSRGDANAILAEHSANGRLRSGATITRIATAFAERSCKALDEALASVSNRIDHRGRRWRSMIGQVDAAIDRHMDRAPELVGDLTRAAGPNSEQLLAPILVDIRSSLHSRLTDYREGWTAPPGKPWRERNALLYAVLLVVAGAVIGEGVKLAFSWAETASKAEQVIGAKAPPPTPSAKQAKP